MKLPSIAIIKYNIDEIKISESVRNDSVLGLRKQTDVLVIDDEGFEPKAFLEQNNYRLTSKTDIDNIRDVSEYDIVLCDIRGVGQKISSSFEGAFVIKEIKKNYPDKFVIAYTASQYDPSYNMYLQYADEVLPKSTSTEEWLNVLDKYIIMSADPVVQWKKLRKRLIDIDVPLLNVARLESKFVDAYLKDEFSGFKALARTMNADVDKIITDFMAKVVVKLIKAAIGP